MGRLPKALAETRIEEYIRLAIEGKHDKALAGLDAILQECAQGDPADLAYAHFAKGNIFVDLGQHDKALHELRTAATLEHNNPSILFNLGIEELTVGHKSRGKEYLQRAAQLGHDKAPTALKVLESGKPLAISHGQSTGGSDIAQRHIERGMASVHAGRFSDAIIEYNRAIELVPNFGHSHSLLGVVYEKLGQFDKALECHNRGIKLDDTNAVAYYNRGVIHGLMDNADAAIADYTRSLELDPSDSDPWFNRGMLHKEAGRYQEAAADFTRALQCNSEYAMAYNDRAICYSQLGQPDKALSDHLRATELRPDVSLFQFNLGGCYINRGDATRGVKHLLNAVLLGDKRAEDVLRELTGKDIDFNSLKPKPD
jgi:Flp pilus assembly protein TadD